MPITVIESSKNLIEIEWAYRAQKMIGTAITAIPIVILVLSFAIDSLCLLAYKRPTRYKLDMQSNQRCRRAFVL
jgi:hypothetical protein